MTKRISKLKTAGIIVLAVVCLSAVVGVTVKLAKNFGNSGENGIVENLALNKTTYVYTDCTTEGALNTTEDSSCVLNLNADLSLNKRAKDVVFTYTWVNPTSTWANGKDVIDFVSLYYKEDDPLSVKLLCRYPFGERIVVTAKLKENEEISTDCVLDYAAKVSKVHMILPDGSELGRYSLNSNKKFLYSYTNDDSRYYQSVTFEYGTGTITPTSASLDNTALPCYSVSNLITSDFMLKTSDSATLTFIEQYCRGMSKRTACVKANGKYKYINFNSPYMFLVGTTGVDFTQPIAEVFASHINGQVWQTDYVRFYFSVTDSIRGNFTSYEVHQALTFTPNAEYVFATAIID